MMNKSKIDWCDFSWNPVTGCRHTCEYCYARAQARRFSGDVRLNKSSRQIEFDAERNLFTLPKPFKNGEGKTLPFPTGFEPTLHEYRLPMPAEKKKPANIFVCSMADLFGEWVPEEWIEKVFAACKAAPQHNYLFLTKNPQRYCELAYKGKLPTLKNFWYGTSITQEDQRFFTTYGGRYNTFVSVEPIQGDFTEFSTENAPDVKWIIVGAETGVRKQKVTPEYSWIEKIVRSAVRAKIPVFLKDSREIRKVIGGEIDDRYRQLPEALQRPPERPIPHCRDCEHCIVTPQGKRGESCSCEIGWESEGYDDRGARLIGGVYSRISPPWCPKRKEEPKA